MPDSNASNAVQADRQLCFEHTVSIQCVWLRETKRSVNIEVHFKIDFDKQLLMCNS